MNTKILTANDLLSGGVVFLTDQSKWSPYISQARISHDADTAQVLETIGQDAVGEQIIVEPFLIDVTVDADVAQPVRFREQLRVGGPSIRAEFSKPKFKEVA